MAIQHIHINLTLIHLLYIACFTATQMQTKTIVLTQLLTVNYPCSDLK